ncbi:MAG: hypothetical protein HYX87_07720 [Chloroflexi bacterium]|nr:hypothetical protein [Chloroflexota bacterium]
MSVTFIAKNIGYPPKMIPGNDSAWAIPAVETLLRWDEQGRPTPHLATDWKVSPDGKSITMSLRKGVKFHDGTDFNAEAVKFNLEAYRKVGQFAYLTQLTSVDVIDEYTVRLNLSQYANTVFTDLGQWSGYIVSPTAVKTRGEEWVTTHPVGTGPFKFKSFTPDVSVVYEKFDGYWQKGKPYLDGVQIDYAKDSMTASAALKAGQLQMVRDSTARSATNANDFKASGLEVVGYPAAIVGLAGDSKNSNSPFANKKVREAVEHAIDKQAINKALGYGFWIPIDQWAPPGSIGENPGYKGRQYDPQKAKQLLAEAGYASGFKTKLILAIFIGKDPMVAVQRYLSDVGIQADIDTPDPGKYAAHRRTEGWSNSLFSFLFGVYPNYTAGLAGQLPPDNTDLISVARPAGWGDLMSRAIGATDFETHKKLTAELVKNLADEALVLPLFVAQSYVAKPKYVRDDNQMKVDYYIWTPESAWFDK